MGALKDAIYQIISDAADGDQPWCEGGAAIIDRAPEAIADYYSWDYDGDLGQCGPGFLTVSAMVSPTEAKAVYLQSLGELADDMPDGEVKTRLAAMAGETADLAAMIAWGEEQVPESESQTVTYESESQTLVLRSARWLDDGTPVDAWNAFHTFVRAKALLDGAGIFEVSLALQTLWQSRCSLADWKGSHED